MSNLLKALRKKLRGDIAVAKANIQVYQTHPCRYWGTPKPSRSGRVSNRDYSRSRRQNSSNKKVFLNSLIDSNTRLDSGASPDTSTNYDDSMYL